MARNYNLLISKKTNAAADELDFNVTHLVPVVIEPLRGSGHGTSSDRWRYLPNA